MVSSSIDDSGKILTISYSCRVAPSEVEKCVEVIRDGVKPLQSGFILLSDWTNLESMDAACAESMGELMELLSEKGMVLVVRVMPDPQKDIGLNLISLFHLPKPVRIFTCENLAEATKYLVSEAPSLIAAA